MNVRQALAFAAAALISAETPATPPVCDEQYRTTICPSVCTSTLAEQCAAGARSFISRERAGGGFAGARRARYISRRREKRKGFHQIVPNRRAAATGGRSDYRATARGTANSFRGTTRRDTAATRRLSDKLNPAAGAANITARAPRF